MSFVTYDIHIVYKSHTIKYADVAELADAPDLGSGGRPWGFKSLHPQLQFSWEALYLQASRFIHFWVNCLQIFPGIRH